MKVTIYVRDGKEDGGGCRHIEEAVNIPVDDIRSSLEEQDDHAMD